MPMMPPITTRAVALTRWVPAVFAEIKPAIVNPTIVTAVILIELLEIRGK